MFGAGLVSAALAGKGLAGKGLVSKGLASPGLVSTGLAGKGEEHVVEVGGVHGHAWLGSGQRVEPVEQILEGPGPAVVGDLEDQAGLVA